MSRFFRRRKYCRFTAEGITEVDYKQVSTFGNLKESLDEAGLATAKMKGMSKNSKS